MRLPHDGINEKIKETNTVIDMAKKELNELGIPDHVQSLQISSLNKRLQDLTKEKEDMQNVLDKESLVLSLYPPQLPSGQISIRTLTVILGGLQSLSDSIANTLFNQPSEKGKIPQEILDQNELVLRETRAGSFIAVLDAKHPEQATLEEPVQSQTIAELFNLLESSDAPDDIAETISRLGPRALKNYTEWTKSIKDLDTSVEMEWLSSYHTFSRVKLSTDKADRIYSILSDFSSTTETEVVLKGILTGANVRTKTFEIVAEDGMKITGKIKADALDGIVQFRLNNECEADLLKITVIGPTNREKTSWTLRGIEKKK